MFAFSRTQPDGNAPFWPAADPPFLHQAPIPIRSASAATWEATLSLLTLAVAFLHRAGPYFARRSEHFWIFAAGSWDRTYYDFRVHDARRRLPRRISVEEDRIYAEKRVEEALRVLGREADGRDVRDLEEALERYLDSE